MQPTYSVICVMNGHFKAVRYRLRTCRGIFVLFYDKKFAVLICVAYIIAVNLSLPLALSLLSNKCSLSQHRGKEV